jgi:tetratricopeptide (TPR) repeat protein
MYVLSLPCRMKSCLILLLLFIASCGVKKQVDEIRVRQIGIEYFLKGEKGYIANSFDSVVYNLNVSSEYINPTDTLLYGEILSIRSQAYIKLNKLDAAIHDLEKLVRMRPANVHHLITLSYLYGETKRFSEGVTILEKAMQMDQSNPVIYNSLAHYSAEAGVYDNAIRYAKEGLKLTHDSALVGALLCNLGFAQAKVVSVGKGVMNCSEGQIKICQNVIKPELEDRPLDSTLKAFVKPGSLGLIFENGFSDSAVVLINNKLVSRVLLRTSSSLGKCKEEVIIDYSHYKEVPRITVELINKGECMYFYPLRNRRAAYINHEIVNKWRVLLSNDRHFYY